MNVARASPRLLGARGASVRRRLSERAGAAWQGFVRRAQLNRELVHVPLCSMAMRSAKLKQVVAQAMTFMSANDQANNPEVT